MGVLKLSQIAAAGAPPALTDQLVGVSGGSVDNLFTLSQISSTIVPKPGGVNTNVQFNNGGVLGGDSGFTYAGSGAATLTASLTNPLVIGGTTASSTLTLESTSGAGTSDFIRFLTGSQAEVMRVDSGGHVDIGGFANVTAGILECDGDGTVFGGLTGISINNNNTSLGFVQYKTRGTTPSSQVIVQNNDQIGNLSYFGSDGAAYQFCAAINTEVDGAPAAGVVPGRLIFLTASSGGTLLTRMRIDSGGHITVGSSANATGGVFECTGNGTLFNGLTGVSIGGNNTSLGFLQFKTRGNSASSQVIVQNNDQIGNLTFSGSDGAAYQTAGQIDVLVDGVPGAGSMPGRIRFSTTPSGSTTQVERMRIDNAGLKSFTNGAFGYGIAGNGDGGTQTQAAGSKANGVVLSTITGQITMANANLAADTTVSFVLTNTKVAITDFIALNHISGGTLGAYTLTATPAGGSATINVHNCTPGALAEAIVIQFALIKAVTS